MRHLKAGRVLGRNSAHRKALFRNLVTALLQRERIQTTLAKAKELRGKAEKTITLGKKGTLAARRRAFNIVNQKDVLAKLFDTLAERYADRNGGYTRIIKLGPRRGDNAPMAIIELVDREEDSKPEPKKEKAKEKVVKEKAVKEKAAKE
jgi:large subunit ribosomal protein L17